MYCDIVTGGHLWFLSLVNNVTISFSSFGLNAFLGLLLPHQPNPSVVSLLEPHHLHIKNIQTHLFSEPVLVSAQLVEFLQGLFVITIQHGVLLLQLQQPVLHSQLRGAFLLQLLLQFWPQMTTTQQLNTSLSGHIIITPTRQCYKHF